MDALKFTPASSEEVNALSAVREAAQVILVVTSAVWAAVADSVEANGFGMVTSLVSVAVAVRDIANGLGTDISLVSADVADNVATHCIAVVRDEFCSDASATRVAARAC